MSEENKPSTTKQIFKALGILAILVVLGWAVARQRRMGAPAPKEAPIT